MVQGAFYFERNSSEALSKDIAKRKTVYVLFMTNHVFLIIVKITNTKLYLS